MARRSPWMQRVAQRPVCRQQAGNPRHEVARSLQAFLDQRNRSQSPALAARHGDERNPVAMAKPMLPPADPPLVSDDRTIIGVGALIQRGGRAVAGMLTIATAGGS